MCATVPLEKSVHHGIYILDREVWFPQLTITQHPTTTKLNQDVKFGTSKTATYSSFSSSQVDKAELLPVTKFGHHH